MAKSQFHSQENTDTNGLSIECHNTDGRMEPMLSVDGVVVGGLFGHCICLERAEGHEGCLSEFSPMVSHTPSLVLHKEEGIK